MRSYTFMVMRTCALQYLPEAKGITKKYKNNIKHLIYIHLNKALISHVITPGLLYIPPTPPIKAAMLSHSSITANMMKCLSAKMYTRYSLMFFRLFLSSHLISPLSPLPSPLDTLPSTLSPLPRHSPHFNNIFDRTSTSK